MKESAAIVIGLVVVFVAGAGSGYFVGAMDRRPRAVVAPPACEDAISRAHAVAARFWLTSYGVQGDVEAKVELARGVGYVQGHAYGRTPQEAMSRAMEILK